MSPDSKEIERIHLKIKRGDTKVYSLKFEDKCDIPIDITGWTVYFTVKSSVKDEDDDAIIKKDVTIHTDPTAGRTAISLSPSDTSVAPGNYIYDIQVKTASGDIHTILENGITISQDVTRRSS
jgi:hypothetical protein